MIAAAVLAVAVAAAPGGGDPRPEIVALARAGAHGEALARVDAALAGDPPRARALGLELLRGDLLERMGRPRDAIEAYAQALSAASGVAPWARYRLALAQERLDHPEVAAGLIASLLAGTPPESLVSRALSLLDRAIARGGDCRLLRGIPVERFVGARRRHRELIDLRCLARTVQPGDLVDAVRDYLAADSGDAYSWEALLLLGDAATASRDRATALLFGLTSYRHRDFGRAVEMLAPWIDRGLTGPFDTLGRDAAYAAARSEFWRGDYAAAGGRFATIAESSRVAAERSDAFHQLGRSRELAGQLDAALQAFDRAYHEDPRGEWAGASLLSALRLESLRGDAAAARRRLSVLAANSRFATLTARGAVFLAVTDLARGRVDGVASLLALAERTREHSAVEIAYWRGRHHELTGDLNRALDAYLETARERPFHPLAEASRRRIVQPAMAPAATARARALSDSSDPASLWAATFLAVDGDRRALARRGVEQLAQAPGTRAWVAARPMPVSRWPVWTLPPARPEDLLLALGLPELVPSTVARAFPSQQPEFGLSGAALLVDGVAARAGLALAESTFSRRPRSVPLDWVAPDWLRTLYPRPWGELVAGQAQAQGVDPHLLLAVMREESRFDPDAISPAAARGLTQLVLPTARRLAAAAQLGPVEFADLGQPSVSITLGAAYLAELDRRFQGEPTAIAAAYNAGEDQAALWLRSCASAEPEELLAKIGFGETRAYVARVLESRNAYRLLAAAGPR
jgi:soluble lytic murein transglycosylase-like protein/tetratricopeptide (TPR) repeat protein